MPDMGSLPTPDAQRDMGSRPAPDAQRDMGSQPTPDAFVARPECVVAADCVLQDTDPPGCAEGSCEDGRCVYRALDRDGDGLRAGLCGAPGGGVEVGADCDDTRNDVHPGAIEVCNATDDDCDFAVDEDIPADPGRPCEVGLGACRATGNSTCVAGQWSGCDASPGAPQGVDFPRCDGGDYDCNGSVNDGCECQNGEVSPELCVQLCGRHERICTNGMWPRCDPNGGEQPQQRCVDVDLDGHLRPGTDCDMFCNPGANGSRTAWNPEMHQLWVLSAGLPQDDCDDHNRNRFGGNPDASCDGTDQDCTGDEPPQDCRHCGQAACGQCPECPPGFGNDGQGRCRQDGAWEEAFGFGDEFDGDAATWYGNGAYDGAYPVPGSPLRDMGHFEFKVWRLDRNPGGCCAQGNDLVARVQCYAWDHGTLLWERDLRGQDFTNSGEDLGGAQTITFSNEFLPGGFCHFLLIDNHNTCCCGCARRFAHVRTYATSAFCR
jgi:hypothetical protein